MKLIEKLSARIVVLEKQYSDIAGYAYAFIAALFFANSSFFIKMNSNLPSSQILLYRSILHTVFAYGFMRSQNLPFHFTDLKVNRLLIMRGFCGFIAISLGFYGVMILPLSTSTIISQVQPIFAGIFAVFFLKEKYERAQIITGLLCLVGVVFIAQPSFLFNRSEKIADATGMERMYAIIALLVSTACASLVQVLVRQVGGKSNLGIITLYFGAISCMLTPIISLIQGFNELELRNILPLLFIGVLTFVGQLLMNRAALFGRAAKVALVKYFGLAYTYMIDIFVLGTELDGYSLIGSLLVFSCLFVSLYQEFSMRK